MDTIRFLFVQFARVYNVNRMSFISKLRPLIYFAVILVMAGLFLLPDPFENIRFPFSDGVRIFDGYTRVNFSTLQDEAIEDKAFALGIKFSERTTDKTLLKKIEEALNVVD